MNWDEYLMGLVYEVSKKSKDLSTNIGAVIVGEDNEILSTGYNSFPMGAKDDLLERQQRPLKYDYFEHAERNAIYLAARNGHKLKHSKLYTNGIPCMNCARGLIQSGIHTIVTHSLWEEKFIHESWLQELERSKELLLECGIFMQKYTLEVNKETKINGVIHKL